MATIISAFLDDQVTGQKMTAHAKNALSGALRLAQNACVEEVTDLHLFFAIFLETGSMGANMLRDFGVENKHFKNLPELLPKTKVTDEKSAPIKLSLALKTVLVRSYVIAKDFGYAYVGTEHMVYALLENPGRETGSILASVGWEKNNHPQIPNNPVLSDLAQMIDFPNLLFKKTEPTRVADNLQKYCIDLNAEVAKKAEPIVGREHELKRIENILGRKNKNNPLLIGSPGVGKTAIVSLLAQAINNDAVPPFLLGKRIMNLDLTALIAGTGFRGEFETRLRHIFREVREKKNVILFIDEIHTVIGAGNVPGGLDLANILKPAISSGEIQIIGATTSAEYKKHFEKDSALERRFQSVQINEPSIAETKAILSGIKAHYEAFHDVTISEHVIDLIVNLADRYLKDRFFPDKALDVLDEASANLRAKREPSASAKKIRSLEKELNQIFWQKEALLSEQAFEKALKLKDQEENLKQQIAALKNHKETRRKQPLTEDDIIETLSHISRIPQSKLSQEKNSKIINIKNILSQKIIGQTEALEKVASVLIRSQFGLGSFERPLGSFLFLGPSGTGKTLTAQILAQEFFGQAHSAPKPLIRIDMSEFMERHSVSGLIGSPAGYVGFGEGGRLTEKVRQNPHSVVLFDEIEKAHPDVFNLLLQILEDGVLTDAAGLEVNFKNTIVILTTNLDLSDIFASRKLGFRDFAQPEATLEKESNEALLLEKLSEKIKPELLNRLDHLVIFNTLTKKDLEKITGLELSTLKKRLEKQNLKIVFSPQVAKFIAEKSLAEKFGARPIRRNIQKLLEEKIAELIMQDELKNNTLNVLVKNEELILK
jgi:ATP-dependent Clp protease ATP-binding subunit ClpC